MKIFSLGDQVSFIATVQRVNGPNGTIGNARAELLHPQDGVITGQVNIYRTDPSTNPPTNTFDAVVYEVKSDLRAAYRVYPDDIYPLGQAPVPAPVSTPTPIIVSLPMGPNVFSALNPNQPQGQSASAAQVPTNVLPLMPDAITSSGEMEQAVFTLVLDLVMQQRDFTAYTVTQQLRQIYANTFIGHDVVKEAVHLCMAIHLAQTPAFYGKKTAQYPGGEAVEYYALPAA